MPPREYAALLLRKAAQDEFTVRKLMADPGSPDEIIGFHAQQAVEKILKAVLAAREIRYRWTHDLVELIDLLRDNGVDFPQHLEDVRRLWPFAAELRYDELPVRVEEPFDRDWAAGCIRRAHEWAKPLIEAGTHNAGGPA